VTWQQVTESTFVGLEVNIGTICACLPTLKPLLNLFMYGRIKTSARLNVPDIPKISTGGMQILSKPELVHQRGGQGLAEQDPPLLPTKAPARCNISSKDHSNWQFEALWPESSLTVNE